MTSIVPQSIRKLRSNNTLTTHSKDETSHTSSSEELREVTKQAEARCLKEISDFFRNFGVRLPRRKLFRYACYYNFDAEEAIEAIREDNYNRYLRLRMRDLEEQFEINALFPLPQLKSRNKQSEVIYMRPSRFQTKGEGCERVIESLCYVLNDLSRTEQQCRNGVTVIADMRDITRDNFQKEDCQRLVEALQGELVPTRVEAFLIVSPPEWFQNKTWKWMKSTMSKEFSKKVHWIKQEERLSEFLMDDYRMYLPDDFCQGLAKASEISEDYVDLKMMQEEHEEGEQSS